VTTALSFGLVASAHSGEGIRSFQELATWFRANVSLELSLEASSTYEALIESLRSGSCDVAWLPPVLYAWLAEAVMPVGSIVRGGKTSYAAALVVRTDDAAREVSELKEARAGWVDPWSASSFVVPRIELARAGIVMTEAFRSETFYGSHRAALLALSRGECDVVGTYARMPTERGLATEGSWSEMDGLDVRVLATFGPIPSVVIACRRNLSPDAFEVVRDAFRRASNDRDARAMLQKLFGGDEVREGLEPGHELLRRAYETAVANGLFDDV